MSDRRRYGSDRGPKHRIALGPERSFSFLCIVMASWQSERAFWNALPSLAWKTLTTSKQSNATENSDRKQNSKFQ